MARRSTGAEQGAAAVEFAIIISLVFVVLFGIIQFGIAYNRYQSINAAAREGARLGSLSQPATPLSAIQDRVLQSLSILNANNFKTGGNVRSTCPANLNPEEGCIEVYQENKPPVDPPTYTLLTSAGDLPCQDRSGQTLKVLVRYRMRITIPLWASPAVNATGTGVFRCE